MAWLPPSRNTLHRGLRIPDLRTGDDSPLRNACRPAPPAISHSRRLPTQRNCRCGLNVTSRTQSQPCASVWPTRSPEPCRDARVAAKAKCDHTEICDAVELEHDPEKCAAVFPRDKRVAFARRSCANKNLERDDD